MSTPPDFRSCVLELGSDPRKLHETLVGVFGQYLVWARNETLRRMRTLLESGEARDQVGTIFREPYEDASNLNPEEQERAIKLVECTVDAFARKVLTMMSGVGFDDPIGSDQVFRFKLSMEICDSQSGEVIHEETLNRSGEKFFPEYWGQWINRHGPSMAT